MKNLAGTIALITVFGFATAVADVPADEPQAAEELEPFDGDAEQTGFGWDRLSVSVGYLWQTGDGRYSLRGPGGEEITIIDLDVLGVDDDDGSPWFTLDWRSRNSRWGAWAGYWGYRAAGARVWEREFPVGDRQIVPVGAFVATELKTDWYIAEATYSVARSRSIDAGFGFGIHTVDIDTTLSAAVGIGGQDVEITNVELDTLAPLPNITGYVYWRFGRRWRLNARYGWFGLSYDKYDGEMTNLYAQLRYDLTERWAVEAGYHFVRLDVDVEEPNYMEVYDLDFKGAMASLRFNFWISPLSTRLPDGPAVIQSPDRRLHHAALRLP